uniref:Dienelactone hydrolase n=1 Tax=uncultured bacterium UPO64 TaxID=1776983 RepID=A0A126SYS1_9BACT|nr:dienelactone hydrolase [uncultured bacterium UPO64]
MKYRFLLAASLVVLAWLPSIAWPDMLPGKSSAIGPIAHASLKTQNIEYRDGDQLLEGYLAYDAARSGKRPAVLIVHDWMGVGPYVKQRAEQLARLGYVAFAVDIYGKGVRPASPEAAGAQAGKYKQDRALFRSRLNAGYQAMLSQRQTDPARTAAIGYCFGGTGVLELARSGADIDGVVSFHGGLDSPAPADGKNIKAKVLILHGAEDPFVPVKDIDAFLTEMRAANVDWQMISYGGAVHSFTNPAAGSDPSTGAAYNAAADRRSWLAMRQFLDELFAGQAR